MSTTRRTRHLAALAGAIASLFFLATANAEPADTVETVEAVWKAQRMNFEYRGFSTVYSCSSLQAKLEKILQTVGAREGLRLRNYSCSDFSGIARFQIYLESPVEATAENIDAITSYSTERELIARVRGEQLATAQDLPRFPAVWKTVSFARSRTMRLSAGDCELVHQVRNQILPKMSIQVMRGNVQCSSGFGNIGPPRLTVSALVPTAGDAPSLTLPRRPGEGTGQ